jgi:hypothetical protein
MAGLSHLRDVYEKRGKDFLENLLNKTVIINERIDGAYFGVKKDPDGSGFNYFKKDSKIGYIDRVLSKYYEPGINHFESMIAESVSKIPSEYVFGMEYSPNRENPLTLTHIKVLDENYQTKEIVHDKKALTQWAESLGVNPPAILFQGKLSDDQKVKIQEFIFTPLESLSERFKTQSFTKHILSVLNPVVDESTQLIEDRGLGEIVFRFVDALDQSDDSAVLAKIVDPVFYDRAKGMKATPIQKKSDDYVWIIVIDLMNFIESFRTSQLKGFTISGQSNEELYMSLLNNLFVEFIKEYGSKFDDLDIQVPGFLTRPEFDVNSDLIQDQRVIDSITKNPNYKEIYRIFINIFRKRKLKISSPLFTDSMKANLEAQIQRLQSVAQDSMVYENYFPSFNEFIGGEQEPGYFETYDSENNEESRTKKVNLLLSEFQPIHKGHIKMARLLTENNGLPTLFVCIHPGKQSKVFPFRSDTMTNALNKVVASDKTNFAGPIVIKNGNIETILKSIKPDYEPYVIAADSSRISDIALQLELAKKRTRNLNIKRDTKLMELPAMTVGEAILGSIKNRDFSAYKTSTPESVHSEFYNLNRDLVESMNESKAEAPRIELTERVNESNIVEPNIIIED